ncbi:MAG TPA: hypothetical protein VHB27_00160 [Rhodopila sp.]|uniref:hypothetical protein n=1 Tax=Rhodopila sp. TaxID=2480087 RepID=UPI002CD6D815|nr:hypothetical protein [Rhodopila sp.]HVY13606.1 hypothetical protein [Rhodopila sp.]
MDPHPVQITDLPAAFLRTILHHIAALLLQGANGDYQEALEAAEKVILGQAPRNDAELRLVARVISFTLQSSEALAQAAQPDMPLNRVLRLRSGAVSLAREVTKAERALERRRAAGPDQSEQPRSEPEPSPAPSVEKVGVLIQENRTVAAYAKAHGISFSEALRRRERDKRVAERERKKAIQATASAAAAPA